MSKRKRTQIAKAVFSVLDYPLKWDEVDEEYRTAAYKTADAVLDELRRTGDFWSRLAGSVIAMLVLAIIVGALAYAALWLWAGVLG